MNEHVLDASALLVVMFGERGAETVLPILPNAVIGTVNLAEVVAKLQERGVPDEEIDQDLEALNLVVIPFDEAQAMAAGKLREPTRKQGLSLGDRACLALAAARGAAAVTVDRTWWKLGLGVEVVVAR